MLLSLERTSKIASIRASGISERASQRPSYIANPIVQLPFGGTRVAVAVGAWSWSGLMRTDDPRPGLGNLVLDSSVSHVIPKNGKGVPTSDTPVLSPNIVDLKWSTDPGGADPVTCMAARHAAVLNRPLPAPSPGKPCSLTAPGPQPAPGPKPGQSKTSTYLHK
jgi:hypothetical protein